jgi:LmbE family N-acetylglucosaminyl deacetylase/GT2 family glycosyltransferase
MEQPLIPWHPVREIQAQSVLVFAAHPDDEVFGCGGSLCRHVSAGVPMHVVVVTDGAYGREGEQRFSQAETRESESRAAAAILGTPSPEFWQLPDGALEYSEQLIDRLVESMRKRRADLVYAPSLHEVHPDHCALAMAAIEAVRRIGAGVRLAMYEIGAPLRPNVLVDIGLELGRKREAMRCFASQNALQRYDEQISALNSYRTYSLPREVLAAEAFELVGAEDVAGGHLGIFASEYERRRAIGQASVGSLDLPLVSVIVRSMDRPSLREALDSIALQTYPNIEVVVVDAKGKGHRPLPDACGRYPMRLIGGRGALARSGAANVGLEEARGRFLIFLDDDDWFYPHHVARLRQALDEGGAAVAAYSSIRCIDAGGVETRRFEADFDPVQLCIDNYIPIHAVLFRREVVDGGARFDEELALCEDWEFWQQVAARGPFRHVPEIGATYRLQEATGSGVWGDAACVRAAMLAVYRKRLPLQPDRMLWSIFEYARYKRLHDELCRTHQGVLAQRDAIIAERDSLLSSTSWRITRPLRALKRIFERFAGERSRK